MIESSECNLEAQNQLKRVSSYFLSYMDISYYVYVLIQRTLIMHAAIH